MKKLKYKGLIIVSLVFGIMLSLQFKIINNETKNNSTYKRGEELGLELKNLKIKEENLKKSISEIETSIGKYKNYQDNNNHKKIIEEINKYKQLAGYTDVDGSGIEVIIEASNSEEISSINYNYDIILSLINKLNAGGAEAISINGQRIVSSTAINLSSEGLLINNTHISQPIVIKAIGNPDTLESSVKIKYGIVWEIENYYEMKVIINQQEKINIEKYNNKIEYKYAKPVN